MTKSTPFFKHTILVKYKIQQQIEVKITNLSDRNNMFLSLIFQLVLHAKALADKTDFLSSIDRKKSSLRKSGVERKLIVGGEPVGPLDRPWLVSIGWNQPQSEFHYTLCGGSLIAPSVILTAASCHYYNGAWLGVNYVDVNTYDLEQIAGVVRMYVNSTENGTDVVIHPDYNQTSFEGIANDVSLIFLPMAVPDISPVTLNADKNVPLHAGDPLDVSGWGAFDIGVIAENDAYYPTIPSNVTIKYITNEDCKTKFEEALPGAGELISDKSLCAFDDGKGACFRDIGNAFFLSNDLNFDHDVN